MKRLIVAALTALFATCALAEFDADAAKAFCETEWENDFQMVAFCVDQQRAGAETLDRLYPDLDDIMSERLAVSEDEWGQDMKMRAFCLEQQISARAALPATSAELPEDIAGIIRDLCTADWGTDFQMLVFCTEQQVAAWRQLNN